MEDASKRLGPLVLVLAALFTVLLVRPATAQLQVSNADGSMSLKFGVLGQAQAREGSLYRFLAHAITARRKSSG